MIWGYVYESYGSAVLVETVNREDGRWGSNLDRIMFSLYDTMDDLPFTIPIQDSIATWQIPDIEYCHVISRFRIFQTFEAGVLGRTFRVTFVSGLLGLLKGSRTLVAEGGCDSA